MGWDSLWFVMDTGSRLKWHKVFRFCHKSIRTLLTHFNDQLLCIWQIYIYISVMIIQIEPNRNETDPKRTEPQLSQNWWGQTFGIHYKRFGGASVNQKIKWET